MSVIEFQAFIDRGTITLPEKYQDLIKGLVRIIILTDLTDDGVDMVEYLIDHPYQRDELTPLKRNEIYEHR